MDFAMNLAGEAPCKHMIRFGMEIGVIANTGYSTDVDAAWAKYYLGCLANHAKKAELQEAMNMVAMLDEICASGKRGVHFAEEQFSTVGIERISNCCLFLVSADRTKVSCDKRWKKGFESIKTVMANRIGKIAIGHLKDSDLQSALMKIGG